MAPLLDRFFQFVITAIFVVLAVCMLQHNDWFGFIMFLILAWASWMLFSDAIKNT